MLSLWLKCVLVCGLVLAPFLLGYYGSNLFFRAMDFLDKRLPNWAMAIVLLIVVASILGTLCAALAIVTTK